MRKFRKIIIRSIAYLPVTATLRTALYRKILGYNIGPYSKIKYGAIWDCDYVSIGKYSTLESFSKVNSLNEFVIGDDCLIDKHAVIQGPHQYLWGESKPKFIAGNQVAVMAYWLVDVTRKIAIGNNVLFAGQYGQIWSHSFDLNNNRLDFQISIGNNIYIGSGSKICGDVTICDNVVISLGSIITSSIVESGVYTNEKSLLKVGNVHDFKEIYNNGYKINEKIPRANQYTIYLK